MVKSRIGSDGTVGMMVRMSEGLRDRIKAAAEANGRSQNSEIVATLEEKYPEPREEEFQRLLERVLAVAPAHVATFIKAFIDREIAAGRIDKLDIQEGRFPAFIEQARQSDD